WEFPHTTIAPHETQTQAAKRLLAELGLTAKLGKEIGVIKHAVTRFRITLSALEAGYLSGRFRSRFYAKARWLNIEQIAHLPVSSPQRVLANVLAGVCGTRVTD